MLITPIIERIYGNREFKTCSLLRRYTFIIPKTVSQSNLSATAHRRLLDSRSALPALVAVYYDLHDHPVAEELPEPRTDDDGDDDVAVEVHGEKHDDVREPERGGVDDGTDDLLQRARPERHRPRVRGRQVRTAAVVWTPGVLRLRRNVPLELALDQAVVLLAEPAEKLEADHHQYDADAGRGHHALVLNPPRCSKKAWARDVSFQMREVSLLSRFRTYRHQSCTNSIASTAVSL